MLFKLLIMPSLSLAGFEAFVRDLRLPVDLPLLNALVREPPLQRRGRVGLHALPLSALLLRGLPKGALAFAQAGLRAAAA